VAGLQKVNEYFNRFVEIVSEILLVVMTIIVIWTVFSRYFLNKTPAWGEETALLCMVWFGFLSMAIGVRDNRHIAVDLVVKNLPASAKAFLSVINKILILIFAVFMIVEGTKMSIVATKNYLPGIKLNSSILYAPVPVSGAAIIYYILTSFFRKDVEGENGDL